MCRETGVPFFNRAVNKVGAILFALSVARFGGAAVVFEPIFGAVFAGVSVMFPVSAAIGFFALPFPFGSVVVFFGSYFGINAVAIKLASFQCAHYFSGASFLDIE